MNCSEILEIQSLSHYCTEGLRLMATIEDAWDREYMFHEKYPDIEEMFWKANDSRDLDRLKYMYRLLCRIHDDVTMG